jgi:uncharacterized phage protein (TIGR02218 family)
MKTLTPAFAAHIREPVTTLAVCWHIQKNDGALILGTQHDRDIEITVSQHPLLDLSGVYRAQAAITGSDIHSGSDMSVDNMDVDGATQSAGDSSGYVAVDISVADIEAGLLDNAPVTVFLVNWSTPDAGQALLRRGRLGNLTRDSEGRYRTEVRGLSQLLSQQIGYVYQDTCNVVRFGDSRCRYDVEAIRIESPITAVVSNKEFSIAEPGTPPPAGYPLGGEVLFLSGENEGYTREVKVMTAAGGSLALALYEELPEDVEIGDEIQITPGCDRRWSTCRAYANLANFRGWGVYIPGTMAMIRGNAPGECEVPLPEGPGSTPPTAPAISAAVSSSTSITITRTTNSSDSDGILHYETQRSLAGANDWTTFNTSNTNPLTAVGLSPDTAYDFRQRAIDTIGNSGTYSNTASATTSEGSSEWEDVTVGMASLGSQLATAGRKVRLDLAGSDYGLRVDTVNGASASQQLTGAFDGSAAIELRPQTGNTSNSDHTYVGIAMGADLWNGGTTDVAQVNCGFCIYYGSRYIDLAETAKVTGVVAAPSLGGETSGSASRAAIFELIYNARRAFSITATTVQSYHQPISGGFVDEGPDEDKLMLLGTTIDHDNDPPLVGQEWLYFEQEVDYRRDRGNPDGRNRVDVWARDGYIGYLEIPLTHRADWDFSYQYAAYFEYIGGLFNEPSVANADNFFRVSHVIFSNNRAKDDRIGPPPGFLT